MGNIAVKDANILIDCAKIHILGEVFQLPYQFQTTDLVGAEVTDDEQRSELDVYVENGSLSLVGLNVEEILLIQELRDRHLGLSLEDCSVMYLAEKENAILLTGDGTLRKSSAKVNIEVHGILWLLRQVYEEGLLTQVAACEKARLLKACNIRLPRNELEKMIKDLC
ncbi:MAG: hypothetical protein AAFO96_27495 [Bacteroidota bacterium]